MPRRRRKQNDGLNLPPALLPDAVHLNPEGWRDARMEWARHHVWGPQMIGFLAFFDETIYWHWTALGRKPPRGCAERYEGLARGGVS